MEELLIWLAFLVFFSVMQSLKKKKSAQKKPTELGDGSAKPTFQDAWREIQAAIQQAQSPKEIPPVINPEPTVERRLEPLIHLKPSPTQKRTREPEFHTMETKIPERRLESKTKYSEKIYTQTGQEGKKTYDDSFPKSAYYDDSYSHPHNEKAPQDNVERRKKKMPGDILSARLRDKNYLSEAFIIQEILNKPLSKRK